MNNTVLALDFGTQGVKGMLIDLNAQVICQSSQLYGFSLNKNGFMEQSPDEWWNSCLKVCRTLQQKDEDSYNAISSIGITAQMHGAVLLDKKLNVIDDCIVWCDTRCKEQALFLQNKASDDLKFTLQNEFGTAYTAPKLYWIKQHKPESYAKIAHILFCKDFIRFKLTNQIYTDFSDASGSLMFDFNTMNWSEELLSLIGLKSNIMPTILPSYEKAGIIQKDIATLLNISESTVVCVGAGDLACSILGVGLNKSGQTLINLGTAGQVLSIIESSTSPPQGGYRFAFLDKNSLFDLHAIASAAYCLKWFMENVTCIENTMENSFAQMDMLAAQSVAGANGLLFAPYLNGTGSPYLDNNTNAAFVRINSSHNKSDMTRAILEGVCFGIKDCINASFSDSSQKQVVFSGGGSNSALWREIMANVLFKEIICPTKRDATCVGAGLLALISGGFIDSIDKTNGMILYDTTVSPNIEFKNIYNNAYDAYKKLYVALSSLPNYNS